jgi:hypothetical protein
MLFPPVYVIVQPSLLLYYFLKVAQVSNIPRCVFSVNAVNPVFVLASMAVSKAP